jgi:2'-5' RNA ligase
MREQNLAMPANSPDRATTLRLFVALWPGPVTRAAISEWQRGWEWPAHAAPVQADRLHLTLHFLGDVPAQRLPQITAGLRGPFEPFALRLGHGEIWPNSVAVLEPADTPPELQRLHAALRDPVIALGLAVDARPFRPHVTLARRARGAKLPAQQARLRWRVDDGYVLVCSLPGGAGYQVVERYGV